MCIVTKETLANGMLARLGNTLPDNTVTRIYSHPTSLHKLFK